MNSKQRLFLILAVILIGGTGGLLLRMSTHQKLGRPGVLTQPLATNNNLEVILPDKVPDYLFEKSDTPQLVQDLLPKDTSFGQGKYKAADGFSSQVNVVLMGSDRTSIHKPEFCLQGNGWAIDSKESMMRMIHMEQPEPYELPAMVFWTSRQIQVEGKMRTVRGVYVFWFVCDGELTANHNERMWSMAWNMITTGVLQRWAYISYFAVCDPGQEEATYARVKHLIGETVPQFQLVPPNKKQVAANH